MIVHNPTTVPVRDYPIQNPEDKSVQLWSVNPGETLDFPDHVGTYLLDTYGFLQRVMTKEEVEEEEKKKKALAESKHFNQVLIVDEAPPKASSVPAQMPETAEGFTNEIVTGELTPQQPVAGKPVESTAEEPMVGGIEGDAMSDFVPPAPSHEVSNVAPPTPVETAKPTTDNKTCPDCGKDFSSNATMKTHYAHAHLNI